MSAIRDIELRNGKQLWKIMCDGSEEYLITLTGAQIEDDILEPDPDKPEETGNLNESGRVKACLKARWVSAVIQTTGVETFNWQSLAIAWSNVVTAGVTVMPLALYKSYQMHKELYELIGLNFKARLALLTGQNLVTTIQTAIGKLTDNPATTAAAYAALALDGTNWPPFVEFRCLLEERLSNSGQFTIEDWREVEYSVRLLSTENGRLIIGVLVEILTNEFFAEIINPELPLADEADCSSDCGDSGIGTLPPLIPELIEPTASGFYAVRADDCGPVDIHLTEDGGGGWNSVQIRIPLEHDLYGIYIHALEVSGSVTAAILTGDLDERAGTMNVLCPDEEGHSLLPVNAPELAHGVSTEVQPRSAVGQEELWSSLLPSAYYHHLTDGKFNARSSADAPDYLAADTQYVYLRLRVSPIRNADPGSITVKGIHLLYNENSPSHAEA